MHHPHALVAAPGDLADLSQLELPPALVARYEELTRDAIFYLDPHVCLQMPLPQHRAALAVPALPRMEHLRRGANRAGQGQRGRADAGHARQRQTAASSVRRRVAHPATCRSVSAKPRRSRSRGRAFDLLLDRPLRREPGARVALRESVARHDPADLFGGLAGGHDHGVEVVVVAGLEDAAGCRRSRRGCRRAGWQTTR